MNQSGGEAWQLNGGARATRLQSRPSRRAATAPALICSWYMFKSNVRRAMRISNFHFFIQICFPLYVHAYLVSGNVDAAIYVQPVPRRTAWSVRVRYLGPSQRKKLTRGKCISLRHANSPSQSWGFRCFPDDLAYISSFSLSRMI
jgi:hypothetical protein